MDRTQLFSESSPCVLAFITRLSIGGPPPYLPQIFATGFFVDSSGVAVTNKHVIDFFGELPTHPTTGESSLAAMLFFPGEDGHSWQMLLADVKASNAIERFTSSDRWHGETTPDIGFVQLGVCDVPTLKLAAEDYYLQVGIDIVTIGYPMGTMPLTALGKPNQLSPFLRSGTVSSVFPFPIPRPHGFTIDIMQQGGSSGSPILRLSDGAVVGMMASGIQEVKGAQSENVTLLYKQNTNISIAESAHIIQLMLNEVKSEFHARRGELPTLKELREQSPQPDADTPLSWESWISQHNRTK